MHFSPIVVAAFAAALVSGSPLSGETNQPVTLAKRSCFSGGEAWGNDKDNALQAVDNVCGKNGFAAPYQESEYNRSRPSSTHPFRSWVEDRLFYKLELEP